MPKLGSLCIVYVMHVNFNMGIGVSPKEHEFLNYVYFWDSLVLTQYFLEKTLILEKNILNIAARLFYKSPRDKKE